MVAQGNQQTGQLRWLHEFQLAGWIRVIQV
jgi:hypothetical protein